MIEPPGPDRHRTDRDYVVMFHGWPDDHLERIYAGLEKQSDCYNFALPTVPVFVRDVRGKASVTP